jgi:hypothetical protein
MEPYPLHYSRRPRAKDSVDPNFRMMLDELQRMEARLKDTIEGHYGGLDRRVDAIEQKTDEHLVSLEMARTKVEMGRADLEKQFDGLHLELGRLNQFMERESLVNRQERSGIFVDPPAGAAVGGADTSHADTSNRDREYGSSLPNSRIPGSGMSNPGIPHCHPEYSSEQSRGRPNQSIAESVRASQGKLPKIQFPSFSGDDPQLWKSHCENYFELYSVESNLWVKVALMHLDGPTTRWFQSAERRLRQVDWGEFCSLLHERFGRAQHEALIRQLFHIRQTSSVTAYVDQFSALVDQWTTYESEANPLYYATRFVDGLREEIRSMVMI